MKKFLLYILASFSLCSCEKIFLEEKPSSNIVRPETLEDLERLLDNDGVINRTGALVRLGSDEYFVPSKPVWESLFTATQRNSYLWAEDPYQGEMNIPDWDQLYAAVFYANSVLEELERIGSDDKVRANNIKGRAYFVRAFAHYDLLNTFAPAYDPEKANHQTGIPLRNTSNINVIERPKSMFECYNFILSDFNNALNLLTDDRPPQVRTRPSRAAALAMLAKIQLNMGEYEQALSNAKSCLDIYSNITDFNDIDLDNDEPFQHNNNDVIYMTRQVLAGQLTATSGVRETTSNYMGIDTNLLQLYSPTDLRFKAFFSVGTEGRYYRKSMFGARSLNLYPFTGLATDEIYLIKAECEARLDLIADAKNTLTSLLQNRFDRGQIPNLNDLSQDQLLDRVLLERRKELVWRSIRWNDLKRLNLRGAEITIERHLGEDIYQLTPNSERYIFPIPDNELIHLK